MNGAVFIISIQVSWRCSFSFSLHLDLSHINPLMTCSSGGMILQGLHHSEFYEDILEFEHFQISLSSIVSKKKCAFVLLLRWQLRLK
jgi:hypothetical protein